MKNLFHKTCALLALVVGMFGLIRVEAATFAVGDVFVSVGASSVQWRQPDGTLITTLTCSSDSSVFTTGMAFDTADNLYVTMFDGNSVCKFNNTGTDIGTFGSGYNLDPESILFDAAGNAYVGQADGSADILKFDSAGGFLAAFDVDTERRGSDWIDLACDQCTMFYTSEGTSIKRFDVCNDVQLADFVGPLSGLLTGPAFALRIIPSGALAGQVLVADSVNVKRISADGTTVLATYDVLLEDTWFAVNLDPDGTSFWSANVGSANVYKFDIATGAQLLSFNTGTPPGTVSGLAVNGELTCGQPVRDDDDDDDFDEDGERDDEDGDDDGDGERDDEDADDDNDGVRDREDEDDDNDGIKDLVDSESFRERQLLVSGNVGGINARQSTDHPMFVEEGTLLVIGLVEAANAESLSVEIFDPSGLLVGRSAPAAPQRALAVATALVPGTYTMRVRNTGSAAPIDYKAALVRSLPW